MESSKNLPIIRLNNITKRYGNVVALKNVNLSIKAGEVIGLVGENGSGKSTLVKVLGGEIMPEHGAITFYGDTVKLNHPRAAIACGIRTLTQFPALWPNLDVVENIFLGQEITWGIIGLSLIRRKKMEELGKELLSSAGAGEVPLDALVSGLSGGQQRSVALARMLAADAKVLIFDEPTASLGIAQQERVTELVFDQKRLGKAIIFISHHINEILTTCDRVVAMRRGEIIADEPCSDISADQLSGYMAIYKN